MFLNIIFHSALNHSLSLYRLEFQKLSTVEGGRVDGWGGANDGCIMSGWWKIDDVCLVGEVQ